MSKENYIIPIFVPHLGCPHDCAFCNQQEITGVQNKITGNEVINKIDDYLATIPQIAKQVEVAFYGGSFTAIEQNYQKELLAAANKRLNQGAITGIRLSTRPDYISNNILNYLQNYGVNKIELGVQSLDDEVLHSAGRGHNRKQVIRAVKLIKKYDKFKLGLQIMPGLPNANKKSDLRTAEQVIDLKPDFVRIYPTLVIEGTQLAELYFAGKYEPLTLEQAVDLTAELLYKFKEGHISVIRIGLQPTREVNYERVIAGPFHPALRQLVESKLILNKIEKEIGEFNIQDLVLTVNSRELSNLKGQKNKNINYLKEKYNLSHINIKLDDNLTRDEIIINY